MNQMYCQLGSITKSKELFQLGKGCMPLILAEGGESLVWGQPKLHVKYQASPDGIMKSTSKTRQKAIQCIYKNTLKTERKYQKQTTVTSSGHSVECMCNTWQSSLVMVCHFDLIMSGNEERTKE